jgi:hypothetical protein
LCLPYIVPISFADNDAVVRNAATVQCDEVVAVEGDDGSFLLGGKGENVFIRDALVGLACVVGGEDIIAQSASSITISIGKFSLE